MLIERIVVVIGTTGTGKSTIINMLYNNEITPDACNNPCTVKASANSVTLKPQWIFDRKGGKIMCDTIGFGDSSRSNDEVIEELKNFLGVISEEIHSIIKYGRLTKEEHLNLCLVSKVFGDNWNRHTVLVLTHCDLDIENENEREKAIQDWINNDPHVNEFVSTINSNVLLVNNATSSSILEKGYRSVRQKLLSDLNCFIANCDELVAPSPNVWTYIKSFLYFHFHSESEIDWLYFPIKTIALPSVAVLTLTSSKIRTVVGKIIFPIALKEANKQRADAIATKLLESQSSITVAECSICMEEINFKNTILTNCHHD